MQVPFPADRGRVRLSDKLVDGTVERSFASATVVQRFDGGPLPVPSVSEQRLVQLPVGFGGVLHQHLANVVQVAQGPVLTAAVAEFCVTDEIGVVENPVFPVGPFFFRLAVNVFGFCDPCRKRRVASGVDNVVNNRFRVHRIEPFESPVVGDLLYEAWCRHL